MEAKSTKKSGWGGKRAGAGRKPRGWKTVPHRTRYKPTAIAKASWLLRRDLHRHKTLVRSLLRKLETHMDEDFVGMPRLVGGYVVLFLDSNDEREISKVMQRAGVRLAKAINAALGRIGRVFVERYRMHSPPFVPAPEPPFRQRLKHSIAENAEALALGLALLFVRGTSVVMERRRPF